MDGVGDREGLESELRGRRLEAGAVSEELVEAGRDNKRGSGDAEAEARLASVTILEELLVLDGL